MRNFFNFIGLEQLYFSLIWNTYMRKLQTFCGESYKQIIALFVRDIWHTYHSWYFKIVSNFTRLTALEITYNNFEISLVVYMPNITTNQAIAYTNSVIVRIKPRTYRGGGGGWMPPPHKVFLSFFLEDKTLAPDVFSSCSISPRADFETSLMMVSCYVYEMWRHK